MNETKTVSKKQKMKKGNMRKTIIMAILCVALLSSATYAWFVLSEDAKITGLSLTVTEAGGLLIAPAVLDSSSNLEPGTYSSELKLTDLATAAGKLKPATLGKLTSSDKDVILKPTYSGEGDKITAYTAAGTGDVMNENNLTGEYYYYEKTFFMTTAGTDLDIQLVADGTYVTDNTNPGGSAVDKPACDAIRIAFFDEDGDLLKVYEPNSEKTWGVGRNDKVSETNVTATATLHNNSEGDIKQNSSKAFTTTGVGTNSETLFTLTQNADTQITMRVYFEGNDPECCNIISANKILGQLKFVAVTDTP